MSSVMTVTGEISSEQLGMTLVHEHLFNDLSAAVDTPSYDFSAPIAARPVDPSIAWALRWDPYCNADNMAQKETDAVRAEVEEYLNLGGRTIVDASGSQAVGRDPEGLRQISEETGVQVVMSTGTYIEKFDRSSIVGVPVDIQVQSLLAELQEGVGETGIRAGAIGEIGVSPLFTAAEKKALRAAAIAQRAVPHIPLSIHMPGWQRRGDEVLDIVLDQEGVEARKVTLCHSDPSGEDPHYQRRLLDRGVWLEFDMIGMDITYPKEGVSPSVTQTADAVANLVLDGYGQQILLSHDLFLKQMWKSNGGNGLTFVPTVFLELLIQRGVAVEEAKSLLVSNPASWFG